MSKQQIEAFAAKTGSIADDAAFLFVDASMHCYVLAAAARVATRTVVDNAVASSSFEQCSMATYRSMSRRNAPSYAFVNAAAMVLSEGTSVASWSAAAASDANCSSSSLSCVNGESATAAIADRDQHAANFDMQFWLELYWPCCSICSEQSFHRS